MLCILEKENIAKFLTTMTEEDIKDLDSPEALKLKFIIMCERPRFTPKKVEMPDEDLSVESIVDTPASHNVNHGQSCLFPPTYNRSMKSFKPNPSSTLVKDYKKSKTQQARKKRDYNCMKIFKI